MNVSVSSYNFVWHRVLDLLLQPSLTVSLSLGQLYVFFTIMYKCWTVTQIPFFKLKYRMTFPNFLEICNLFLLMMLLVVLAI
jgi:hypothetical protein